MRCDGVSLLFVKYEVIPRSGIADIILYVVLFVIVCLLRNIPFQFRNSCECCRKVCTTKKNNMYRGFSHLILDLKWSKVLILKRIELKMTVYFGDKHERSELLKLYG